MKEKQNKILNQAIKMVPFDGWGDNILKTSAKNAGLDENYAKIAFKNGAIDAVSMFLDNINTETFAKIDAEKLKILKIREKIFYILNCRFETMEEYKPVIRKTVQFLAMPQNIFCGTKFLWQMTDKIWYAAGDTSTDFNYYTKRTTLAGVYSSTLLFWLEDTSENYNDTKEFLKRRIENVMQFERIKGKIKGFCG